MTQPPARDLAARLLSGKGGLPSGRFVLGTGVVLALAVATAAAWLGNRQYQADLAVERARGELLARVLEDHATRTVETSAIALASMAELLAAQPAADATEIGPSVLNQALIGLPFLRGVAVLDRQGNVLTSSLPAESGRMIDLRMLGPWPAAGRDRLGALVPGRNLGDLVGGVGPSNTPPGVGFIPLMRQVQMRSGEGLLVVALINPDALSNHMALTLGDERSAAVLADYGGIVLVGTPSAPAPPGAKLSAHPVFARYLAQREHGSFLGDGVRPQPQVVAFRVSRLRPLVVITEHPQAVVQAVWWESMRGFFVMAGVVILFVIGMTVTARRSLRAREAVRHQLDIAQADVAERERELSVTIKSVQELIFRADARGVITFANARWSLVTGVGSQGAVGRRLSEFVPPEQRDAVQHLFAENTGLGVRSIAVSIASGDGAKPLHFDVAVVPLLQGGRVAGFAGSAVDVTERVVAQNRLQTQHEVTSLMLEISPLPLCMVDLDGRLLRVNQAWEDFAGLARDEVIGQDAETLMPGGGLRLSQDERVALVGGRRLRHEANVVHRDGSRRDVVLIRVAVPGDHAQAAGVLCVLMDVSEFRAAERATLEARDAAEEASRAKNEFVANMSHELRTPLQSIIGFSELGQARAGAQPKLAAMFDDIHRAGQRMLALVNDLLDVAKIESTVGTFHLERADLRPLVRDVLREVEPLVTASRLRVDLRLPEYPLVAKVDPSRLQQVVRNVMANAIKFSPQGGEIVVKGEINAGAEIHLSVRDHGPGIPPAELDVVFDAFVQSSQTKDGSGGTGLGLAICRKIVDAHGGRIHAENAPDRGAVFHIHLPAKGGAETMPAVL